MKTLSTITILATLITLMNCEMPRNIEAGVLWSDDTYFAAEGDWYLAISEGSYSNEVGAVVDVVDQMPITFGKNEVVRFDLGSGSAGNITAFVYLDRTSNGIYDDGYDLITGYKYNYSDPGETTCISVSAYF